MNIARWHWELSTSCYPLIGGIVSYDREFRRLNLSILLPIGTAFHDRTFPLCQSLDYREWSGFYAVSVYEMHHEHEYNAIRNAAALIDVTPLFKYIVDGKDATQLVNRVITRDINRSAVGQVIYCCWCDEEGKVIDDGTITRLAENTIVGQQPIPACAGFVRTL